ncbi:oxidoreductase [Seonamhaeicola sp.]|uniref:WD40/YVTN/BNR-like repeat-containing protein n=1 Tax=Seonamhaeicola sp. TaxID=1912245 RepID=UPI00260294F3|nr:oxidoreductase [Seonamhaeicola sp.]
MKKLFLFIVVAVLCFSCKREEVFIPRNIVDVEIETVFKDSLLSLRAIEIMNKEALFIAGNNSFWGVYAPYKDTIFVDNDFGEHKKLHFRAAARTNEGSFALSIESPARLFADHKLVYQENHPKAFYDSMDFWNDKEGIAIGDPTGDCMSIIITRDGGATWTKLSCDDLPKAKTGEGAFAASDTNIAIVDDHAWVATGGKASRVLYSPDKGNTWEMFETPIVQGAETTGIFSIDFYDELNGFAIGGDYTRPDDNVANKIRTTDGGKTWQLVAENKNPGFRSCVQYMPGRKGQELVAIGFKGIDYSNDAGASWKHLSDEGFYTIRFLNDSVAYAAGAGRISKLIFSE